MEKRVGRVSEPDDWWGSPRKPAHRTRFIEGTPTVMGELFDGEPAAWV